MNATETGMAAIAASPAAEAVARALVHFLWQGALVGVATGGILALLDKAQASTRYAVATGALLLMAACRSRRLCGPWSPRYDRRSPRPPLPPDPSWPRWRQPLREIP